MPSAFESCSLNFGTTALAAKNLQRSYVGYEINPEYCDLAEKRLSEN